MKRTFGRWSAFAASAAVAGWLLAVPVAAQTSGASPRGGEGGGARSGAGGGASGGAVARGGDGGGASTGGTSAGTSSGGGSTSTSGGGSASSPGNMSGGAHGGGRDFTVGGGRTGHERGGGSGQARGGSGSSGGGQHQGGGAVARQPMTGTPSGGSSSGGTSTGGRAVVRDGGTRNGRDVTTDGSSAPPYSRPRGDNPKTGTAVPRTGVPPSQGGTSGVYGYPWYYPWGFGGLGYYGLYDPWYDPWGYYDPYGGGYGQYPTPGYDQDEGSVRLKVKPREAEVYVDGYYTGLVDEYDGVFQRLHIAAGPHRIELRAPGYESLTFDIRVEAHRTLTFKGELKKIE